MKCPRCNGSGEIKMGNKLNEKLAYLREVNGLSLREVSKKIDIPNVTIHHIETGRSKNPSVYTVAKLAKVYGISLDELLDKND